MTHWLGDAAARAGLKGSSALLIPSGASSMDAWEIGARAFSTTPTELASRLAPSLGIRAANFDAADPTALRLVPERLARKYGVYPLRDGDREIVVATSDPQNIECEQALAFAAGRRVVFEVAPPHLVNQAINSGYAADRSVDALAAHLDSDLIDAVRVVEEERPEAITSRDVDTGPVVRLTNLILRDAVTRRASDVHIEPGEGNGVVRFRIDGVIRQFMQLHLSALNRVVSRIKVLAKLDIADRLRPQDGRARIEVDSTLVDLRVSTVPIRGAEKVVIRVLRPDANKTLDDVKLAPVELARLRKLMAHRDGIVLVTGPTGSGKTTTMYAALRELAHGDVNIMTVEDPVEYQLPEISQIQTDAKRDITFASALRAILRQDPDVIFVGEIRDLETAAIAVQAAMTGHLVLATLHTNDAASAVARLLDLGLEPSAVAATIRGSLAQRLVRRVCEECARRAGKDLTDDETRLAALFGVPPTVRAVGCSRCGNTGYYGRIPINEVAVFTPQMAEQILQGASTPALQRLCVSSGMRTLRTTGIERVTQGETTLAEIERVVGGDEPPDTGTATVSTPDDTSSGAAGPVDVAGLGAAILVVDDDPVQRLLLTATLEKQGYRVSASTDGVGAMEWISAGEECALVLTDLHMPGMDGDVLIRTLRADPRTVALPIIVLTGSEQKDRESELIDVGADDYLRKPVDPTRLLARVRAVLRRSA
jgi:type II secretory ATPase GspE/PulE/Tfp pilus assembly ATPase PilB-like protein/CheY-like chemotaxis protein